MRTVTRLHRILKVVAGKEFLSSTLLLQTPFNEFYFGPVPFGTAYLQRRSHGGGFPNDKKKLVFEKRSNLQ